MRIVEHPTVFFIGETRVVNESKRLDTPSPDGVRVGLPALMQHFGCDIMEMPWWGTAKSDGDLLPEVYGRLCYKSFMPGLNPNVEQVRSNNATFVNNAIRSGHGSVLEHAQLNFVFCDVTRVFTHELVRHRIGVAISQESLRYVRLTDLAFRFPEDELRRNGLTDAQIDRARQAFSTTILDVEGRIRTLTEAWGFNDPDRMPFDRKKKLTSILRRIAPIGLCTNIGWSCNLRALRNVIEQRTSLDAEEEIRWVFDRVAKFVSARYPAVFQDYEALPAPKGGPCVWEPLGPRKV